MRLTTAQAAVLSVAAAAFAQEQPKAAANGETFPITGVAMQMTQLDGRYFEHAGSDIKGLSYPITILCPGGLQSQHVAEMTLKSYCQRIRSRSINTFFFVIFTKFSKRRQKYLELFMLLCAAAYRRPFRIFGKTELKKGNNGENFRA